MTVDLKREMLRHTLATLAYRGRKAVTGAPPAFGAFRTGEKGRTSGEILAHIGDLMDWALSIARGKQAWKNSAPLPWDEEAARFFGAVEAFAAYLAPQAPPWAAAGPMVS